MVVRNLSKLLGTILVQSDASALFSDTLSHVKTAWSFERLAHPWHCRQEFVSEFLTQHQDHFIFLPCDKNVGKSMVMCKCLYYKKLLQIYSDETQFEVLADFHTPKEATQYATKLLHQHACTCGVHKHWRESKQSAARHSFIFPKNKMREWQGEWKQRVLFSHYRHPMRYWGRLVGRALTLLLKEGKRLLPSTAILTTRCVTRFVRRWNTWFSQQPQHPPVELFELDVAEMFPSLDRAGVISAHEKFH